MMNLELLLRELLASLRGGRTKAHFGKLIGATGVQVSRWETGAIALCWSDFVGICISLDIPIKDICESFLEVKLDDLNQSTIIKVLIGFHKIEDVAKQIGMSKRIVGRWLSEDTNASLSDIFRVMYKSTNFLLEFVNRISRGQGLPSFRVEISLRQRERDFHFKYPEFAAIIRSFEITEIEGKNAYSPELAATYTGVPAERITYLIAKALSAKILFQDGPHLKVVNKSLSTRGDIQGKLTMLAHWNQILLKSILSRRENKNCAFDDISDLSYLVLTTNSKTDKKIQKLNAQYRASLFKLLHHDDNRSDAAPLDRILVMQHSLLNLSR